MHELGIAHDLFTVVKNEAKKNNINKVSKIIIKLGEASGIKEDFLRHSFVDHILPGSIADGAVLEIVEEPLKVECKDCGKIVDGKDNAVMECPNCNSMRLEIVNGLNVYVESIEGEPQKGQELFFMVSFRVWVFAHLFTGLPLNTNLTAG